jgi:hypothetical protein
MLHVRRPATSRTAADRRLRRGAISFIIAGVMNLSIIAA